ncbi:hypothetical protein FM117_08520 [Micrococcus luteus Mu201]|nr:hypothetical protein FM117_08520 [Micrococcus luteus Mu201]
MLGVLGHGDSRSWSGVVTAGGRPAPPCARFKRKPIARQARGAADGRRPVEPGRARRSRRAVPDPAGHGAVPGVRGAGGGSG